MVAKPFDLGNPDGSMLGNEGLTGTSSTEQTASSSNPGTGSENKPSSTDSGTSFSDTVLVGFEGVNWRITYNFKYPAGLKTRYAQNGLEILEGNKVHSLYVMSNDAAGFTFDEYVEQVAKARYCTDCSRSKTSYSFAGMTGQYKTGVYENGSKELVVIEKEVENNQIFSLFVIQKPDAAMQKVVASYNVSATRTSDAIKESQVKVFFTNAQMAGEGNECNRVFAVARSIFNTNPRTAGQTIFELLNGPTDQEKAQGYTSAIPVGAKLNSLSIKDGVAYADFNAATESGGGSCSMAARVQQIKQTLLQFSSIKEVKLSINGVTEPIFQP